MVTYAQERKFPVGLAGAVLEVIDILRGWLNSRGDGLDPWERFVRMIAERDSLSHSEVEIIERAVAEAYNGWSDAQRRAIWYQTESGMADCYDEDESPCDPSLNGIGHALQVEMLEEVTRAAWQDAEQRREASAKRSRDKKEQTKRAHE